MVAVLVAGGPGQRLLGAGGAAGAGAPRLLPLDLRAGLLHLASCSASGSRAGAPALARFTRGPATGRRWRRSRWWRSSCPPRSTRPRAAHQHPPRRPRLPRARYVHRLGDAVLAHRRRARRPDRAPRPRSGQLYAGLPRGGGLRAHRARHRRAPPADTRQLRRRRPVGRPSSRRQWSRRASWNVHEGSAPRRSPGCLWPTSTTQPAFDVDRAPRAPSPRPSGRRRPAGTRRRVRAIAEVTDPRSGSCSPSGSGKLQHNRPDVEPAGAASFFAITRSRRRGSTRR